MKRYTSLLPIFLTAGVALLTAGCQKVVDLTPEDVLPVSSFYKSETDFRDALTGTYGNLRTIYNGWYQFAELPADNARTFAESESAQGPFDKMMWTPSTGAIATAWNDAYRTIANANIILDKIDAVSFSRDSVKIQYKAEAKFLRGLMYFNLVRYFGGVPLVLTEVKTEAEAYAYVRSSAAEVYAQIEKDVTEAAAALPLRYTGANVGRASSGAAKALLGKVLLQQKKWMEAETVLAEVVAGASGYGYQLLSSVTNVFGLGKDNNAEIIFAVQYVATGFGEGNSYVHTFAPQGSGTLITNVTGNSTCVGTLDLNNAFEATDQRKAAFLGTYGTGNGTYYWARKFIYPVTIQNEGENDWPVLRYADALLMYAEALNNNGKTTQALAQMNSVRVRAGLVAKTGLGAADTQLAIEQERRVELCFEGHRWYDLIRWDKDVSTMTAFKANYTAVDAANRNMSVRIENRLLPIPTREIQLNNKLAQNPGY